MGDAQSGTSPFVHNKHIVQLYTRRLAMNDAGLENYIREQVGAFPGKVAY